MMEVIDDICEECLVKPSTTEGKGGYLCKECYVNRKDIDEDMEDVLLSCEDLLENIGVKVFDSKWICKTCHHMHTTYIKMSSCTHQTIPNKNYVFFTKKEYNELYNGKRNLTLSYLLDDEFKKKIMEACIDYPYLRWNGTDDDVMFLTCEC